MLFAVVLGASPQRSQDMMTLYRQGREFEAQGKTPAALDAFSRAVAKSEQALAANPRDMDAHTVRCWSLFRLGKHQDVLDHGKAALRFEFDARIVEIMGESSYLLGQNDAALSYLTRYLETAGEAGNHAPNAYYYIGEVYMRRKKFAHADIAFATALSKAPHMYRWWYRLGIAREAQGMYRRAYDAFSSSLAISPSFAEAAAGRDRVRAKAEL